MTVKKTRIRLDVKIVELGLSDAEREAQALIMAGHVFVNDQKQDKPGTLVKDSDSIRVKGKSRFVSRGGDKLFGAAIDLGCEALFQGATVLDCGASTGGFTDCSLQLGAKKVYAIEMGFNQLDWKLKSDPRVDSRESTDIRDIKSVLDEDISLVLADLSFNSLDRTLKSMKQAVRAHSVSYLLLVKPQFELDSSVIPALGVVHDPVLQTEALEKVRLAMAREGIELLKSVASRVKGTKGNQEIFVLGMTKPLEKPV